MATQHASLKRLRPPLSGFIVDGFNFCEADVRHYLLTHAHSDHTCGLHASFDLGTVYCSSVTARVLRATIGLPEKRITTIDVGQSIEVEGVQITALDAGHCPGSLMFLLEHLATGHTALHTGDMRASQPIREAVCAALLRRGLLRLCHRCNHSPSPTTSAIAATAAATAAAETTDAAASPSPLAVDVLYLDTTYSSPRWRFPPQPDALRCLAAVTAAELRREPRTLFVVGSYQVGKEKAIAAVARAAGGRALLSERRALSLKLCGLWDAELHTVDAADPQESSGEQVSLEGTPRGAERSREEPRGAERSREEPRGAERSREEPILTPERP